MSVQTQHKELKPSTIRQAVFKRIRLCLYIGLTFFGLNFTSCCGYRFNDDSSLSSRYQSVTVPYVGGDFDGSLTASIINELEQRGTFAYRPNGADLVLRANIVDSRDVNIGFRYDRRKSGELRKSIIPTETRRTTTVEITVEEAISNTILLGPVRISANVDFDHDYEYARDEVNVFSLGQLSDINQAIEASKTPLNHVLAKKITDFIMYSW